MLVMLCRNRVEDYDRWRKVFDANHAAAHEAGLHLKSLWREADDPNNIFFLFEIEDRGRAEAFISTPEAAEAGRVSGVLDGECHFLESDSG